MQTIKGKNVEMGVLISEEVDLDINPSSIKQKGEVYSFETPLNHTKRETQNGNLFNREYLESGLNKKGFQRRLENRALYGEMDHPLRKNPERYINVWNKFRSHLFTDLWFDGNLLMGQVETAKSRFGRDLANYIDQGSLPAFSLRAVGKVKQNDRGQKQKHLTIITWDNVFDASEEAAWGETDTFKTKGPREKHSQGNDVAKELFMEADFEAIDGVFKELDQGVNLVAESFEGFEPDKAIYTPDDEIIGFYSESKSAHTKLKGELKKEVSEFMKI